VIAKKVNVTISCKMPTAKPAKAPPAVPVSKATSKLILAKNQAPGWY